MPNVLPLPHFRFRNDKNVDRKRRRKHAICLNVCLQFGVVKMWSLFAVGIKDTVEPIMFNKLNLVLICLSSVAVAVFVSLMPESLTFWGYLGSDRRPLGVKLTEEFGCGSDSQHAVTLNTLQLHKTTMLQLSQASVQRNDGITCVQLNRIVSLKYMLLFNMALASLRFPSKQGTISCHTGS